jgi:hypothetical protein
MIDNIWRFGMRGHPDLRGHFFEGDDDDGGGGGGNIDDDELSGDPSTGTAGQNSAGAGTTTSGSGSGQQTTTDDDGMAVEGGLAGTPDTPSLPSADTRISDKLDPVFGDLAGRRGAATKLVDDKFGWEERGDGVYDRTTMGSIADSLVYGGRQVYNFVTHPVTQTALAALTLGAAPSAMNAARFAATGGLALSDLFDPGPGAPTSLSANKQSLGRGVAGKAAAPQVAAATATPTTTPQTTSLGGYRVSNKQSASTVGSSKGEL